MMRHHSVSISTGKKLRFFKLCVKPFNLLFRYFKAKFACFTSNEIFGMFTGLSRSVRTDAVIENDRNLARSLINVNLFPSHIK